MACRDAQESEHNQPRDADLLTGGQRPFQPLTCYTSEAGRCLVIKTRVGNRPLVMVLLNSQGKLSPLGDANRIKRWLEGSQAANASKSGRKA